MPVPEKPALADENSKEGLESFTKYWYELLSYGYETGDVDQYSAYVSSECTFCLSLADGVSQSYIKGRWLGGGKIRAENVDPRFEASKANQMVIAQVLHDPVDYFNADGTKGRESSTGSNAATVIVASYSGDSWVVSELSLVG